VNDFWAEYKNNRIHQFYSNLSILDNFGSELKEQTISVNNPLRYQNIDFYQSDWNLLGVRIENQKNHKIYELPLFPLKENTKSWVTWFTLPANQEEKNELEKIEQTKLKNSSFQEQENIEKHKPLTLIFDQFQNIFFLYDNAGIFIESKNIGDTLLPDFKILEILPSTGLLIKYDPSIFIIYLGFGILMITTLFSYLPYTQIWIFNKGKQLWIGSSTNRGKIQLELQFENLLRESEMSIQLFKQRINELEKN
jgi:cytochrome c biogenesis protein